MRTILLTCLCLGLSACATPVDAPMSENFGLAVASMQNQVIPAPVSDLPPDSSAARSAAAIARYEKGEVKELEAQGTSDVTFNVIPYGGK